jgi:hypothetical protein
VGEHVADRVEADLRGGGRELGPGALERFDPGIQQARPGRGAKAGAAKGIAALRSSRCEGDRRRRIALGLARAR